MHMIYYHGTRADLRARRPDRRRPCLQLRHAQGGLRGSISPALDAAIWGAELARGEGARADLHRRADELRRRRSQSTDPEIPRQSHTRPASLAHAARRDRENRGVEGVAGAAATHARRRLQHLEAGASIQAIRLRLARLPRPTASGAASSSTPRGRPDSCTGANRARDRIGTPRLTTLTIAARASSPARRTADRRCVHPRNRTVRTSSAT